MMGCIRPEPVESEKRQEQFPFADIPAPGSVGMVSDHSNVDVFSLRKDGMMKARRTIGLLILIVAMCPKTGPGATLMVEALVDGRDELFIPGNTLQWKHFDYSAVGRHGDRDEPTIITTAEGHNTIIDQTKTSS
jgi:hypothetical protein